MQLLPYLYFDGDCEVALRFYEKCFGGRIEEMVTHAGTPAEQQVPAEWRSKILHARLAVGDVVLMASDAPPGRYHKPQGFSVSIQIPDLSRAERTFRIAGRERHGHHAVPADFLCRAFRHAGRQVRHSVDGELRLGALIGGVPAAARGKIVHW